MDQFTHQLTRIIWALTKATQECYSQVAIKALQDAKERLEARNEKSND